MHPPDIALISLAPGKIDPLSVPGPRGPILVSGISGDLSSVGAIRVHDPDVIVSVIIVGIKGELASVG